MRIGPWNTADDEDEEMADAREEMETFLDEAKRNPFLALDHDIEDNPAYDEYEDEVKDVRFTAFAMMDDLDGQDAGDAGEDDGSLWDE
jgi:hypothetical protein